MSKINGMLTVVHLKDSSEVIGNVELICRLLEKVVNAIGMTPLGTPTVFYYPENTKAEGTHTIILPVSSPFIAVQCLYESFVAYDNWPEKGYAHMVIDSCNPYDIGPVIDVIHEMIPTMRVKIETPV
ncbi:MAG: S-adenosylmethionine decarboxylase, partial [Candidatus Thorarchaeota archaeon]